MLHNYDTNSIDKQHHEITLERTGKTNKNWNELQGGQMIFPQTADLHTKQQVKLHTTLSTSAKSSKVSNKSSPRFLKSNTESFLRMRGREGWLALPVPLNPVAGYITALRHHSAAALITATAGGTGQKHSEVRVHMTADSSGQTA